METDATDYARLRELAAQIVERAPGVAVYGGGTGQHLFTELARPDDPLWPGGAGQKCEMVAGDTFDIHAHHSCTEILIVVCGVMDLSANGVDIRLAPGDSYRLLPGEAHAATAVTDCIVVGITVPRDAGYPEPEATNGPDGFKPGPAS